MWAHESRGAFTLCQTVLSLESEAWNDLWLVDFGQRVR